IRAHRTKTNSEVKSAPDTSSILLQNLSVNQPSAEERTKSLRRRNEASDELRTPFASAHGSGEARAGQLLEPPLGFRHRGRIGGIEFVADVARRIHHALPCHVLPSFSFHFPCNWNSPDERETGENSVASRATLQVYARRREPDRGW